MVASAVLTTLEQLLHKIKANRRREMGYLMIACAALFDDAELLFWHKQYAFMSTHALHD